LLSYTFVRNTIPRASVTVVIRLALS